MYAGDSAVIRNEELECFLLGFGLEIPDNGLGRPTAITPLWLAAQKQCGDCDKDELLDALYNLNPNDAELSKCVGLGTVFQLVSFEERRHTPRWHDFFTVGDFRIKVLPPGRVRFQKLSAEMKVDDDRKFARLAIDEARKSVPENDGRPHPWVGAVVVKDGRVLGTAHRGEVPGNHAEFVALERNLPDVTVAGATVYTTLEPCTTRTPPKIPCVDRLIERKVARVVIGILDPDDRIRGKGQRKLSNAGIETALFPHDLAMEVEELNREFTRFCEKQSLTSQTHPANSFAPARGLKPLVVPLRYGPSPPSVGKHTMGHHGLIVANHGEPAYDVSVSTPKIQIGTSELRFEGSRPVFTKADGDAFFIGTIELAPHYGTLGSGLFEEMRKFKVDEIIVKLIYKDAENRWYETIGKIERDVSVSGGLSVRYVRQENLAT